MSKKIMEVPIKEMDIIHKGNANHQVGIESVGGKLYLTSDKLIFQSHKLNVQKHVFKIKVEEIKDIKFSSFPFNAFEFFDKDGNKEKFVVNGRKKWIAKIEEMKKGET